MATPPSSQLHSQLQTAVKTVQWTYSVFWQICPQQGSLVWGEGHYNGAIKTRKTVQPMEVNEEDACPLRSQQLRELYDSLIVGETTPTAKRPCAALSPEDLTELEWFYLMCISFSFSPGMGLPGKAYSRRRHVWMTNAGDVDCKTFCRSILAKSAGIQTVLCLPLLGGVVELGTVDKVKEDLGFVQRVKAFFPDNSLHLLQPQKPALSAHSTCGSATSFDLHHTFNSPPLLSSAIADGEEEEDNDDVSDSEAETERYGFPDSMADATVSEPNDIMQMEVEDTRVGSPGDRSENLESDFQLVDVYGHEKQTAEEIVRSKEVGDPYRSGVQAQASGTYPLEDQLDMEDDHYSETVSTIIRNQSSRWANSSTARSTSYPTQSAFSSWTSRTSRHDRDHLDTPELEGTSQWVLKYVLFTVPLLHAKQHDENFSTLRFRKGTPQDDFNTNHVLAERRRREKLNERFIILRSLVPFVTKMDKASILGDTIEYVKQLCKKIQDLEACNRRMEADLRSPSSERQNTNSWKLQTSGVTQVGDGVASSYESEKRKMRRMVEGSDSGAMPKTLDAPAAPPLQISREADVQVSIIGSDALLEIQCQHKEGLLLDVMQMLRELLIEITTIQSSSSNGVFIAELKAKVKENSSGKRASIVEVKRALQRIIPHSDT